MRSSETIHIDFIVRWCQVKRVISDLLILDSLDQTHPQTTWHGHAMMNDVDLGWIRCPWHLQVWPTWPIRIHMGVDQNKGIWGSYNRRSSANQPRSQRCINRRRVLSYPTPFGAENRQNIATYHSILETWREPEPTQADLTIAGQ